MTDATCDRGSHRSGEIQVLDRLTYQVRDTPAMYAQIERRYSSIAGAKSAIRAAIRRGNTVSA